MGSKILTLPGASERDLARCRDIIRFGGLIAYPTDTFYGLGADPASRGAVRRFNRLREANPEDVDKNLLARLSTLPGHLATLQAHVVPHLFNGGNAPPAITAYINSMESLASRLEALSAWRSPAPGTLPPKLNRKLRAISSEIDEIVPKDHLNNSL